MSTTAHLSKSRFLAGLQCSKRLWWTVHEPDAPELNADDSSPVFERGRAVGELARERFPGAVLIDLPRWDLRGRVAATERALAAGSKAICEASFLAGGLFASIDVLEKKRNGFVLTEVKSTTRVKDDHIVDVAVQLHAARAAGVNVVRTEVMHLNRKCRHPDLDDLFVRKNVTPQVKQIRKIPREVRRQLRVLDGAIPEVATGSHCTRPYPCPFLDRCCEATPKHHVSTLHGIRGRKLDELVASGCETIHDLPDDHAARGVAARQIRSVRSRRIVVEPGLAEALRELPRPIAFLDFETISPPVPLWRGCRPYDHVPVQLSCHVVGRSATPRHHAWLAEDGCDPRETCARALIDACAGARTVIAYNAAFERRCIESLVEAVPRLKKELTAVIDRLHDLLPIVRDHVYHPAFEGSFSIKSVLPALVKNLSYDDLEIRDGGTASALLEALLLDRESMSDAERARTRANLLRYCERDTLAMVKLHEQLVELGAGAK